MFFSVRTNKCFSLLAVGETNVTLLNLIQIHGSKYGLADNVNAIPNLRM